MVVTVTPEVVENISFEAKEEIDRFEAWFMNELKNGDPLTRHERAILFDYLGYKHKTQG
jgi:hypothetical protein